MAKRRCRVCLQLVDTYEPTGARGILRAELHPLSPTQQQGGPPACTGSFGPTDEPERAAREDAGTRRWAATHTGNLTDYLRDKGESR